MSLALILTSDESFNTYSPMASNILTKTVCNAMKRIAPPILAGSWDNVSWERLLFESFTGAYKTLIHPKRSG
jgi:hypothetical protein